MSKQTSNKSPFEIRLDVLHLAKDYLDKQWQLNREIADAMLKSGQHTAKEIEDKMALYTPEEMIKQAEKLYQSFICKKGE